VRPKGWEIFKWWES